MMRFQFVYRPGAAGEQLDGERIALARRIRLATDITGRTRLLEPLRRMTDEALDSAKLPTTWRSSLYPSDGAHTLTPAFFVWSKAPKIIAAFEDGATIAPHGGKRFLWIPTENLPRGRGGARMAPREAARRYGKLGFIPTKRGGYVVYATVTRNLNIRLGRRARASSRIARAKKGETGERVALYVLAPQVTLRKRLDIAAVAREAGADYRNAFQKAAASK